MLIEFFGETCPHCKEMAPLVDRLKSEEGVEIEQLEVWNNEENMKKMESLDQGKCGGVPFFINTETGKFICGSTDYDSLKNWAKGQAA